MSSVEDWNKLKVVDLKAELKQRGLSTVGRKEELAQRLADDEAGVSSGQEPANDAAETNDDEQPVEANDAPADTVMGNEAPQAEAAEPADAPEPAQEPAQEPEVAPEETLDTAPVPEPKAAPAPFSMDVDEGDAGSPKRQRVDDDDEQRPIDPLHNDADIDMADTAADNFVVDTTGDVAVAPEAIHPPTNGLYIANLMRPLRPMLLDRCLADLAGSNDAVTQSFLDPIKTHAFVIFRDADEATRVRDKLHGRVWPDERARRPLWIDFVPADSILQWIDEEKSDGAFFSNSGRGGGANSRFDAVKRFEIVYSEGETIDGGDAPQIVTTLRQIGSDTPEITGKILFESSMLPAQSTQKNSPPPFDAPRGPRGKAADGEQDMADGAGGREQRRRRGRDVAGLDDEVRTTRTSPALDFRVAHPDIVRRRQDNIGSYRVSANGNGDAHSNRSRSRDPRGGANQSEYTKTHNRYSFDAGNELVDRGPELFDGIRPPHRERERRQQQRGRGGNGGGGGPRFSGGGPPTGPRGQGGPGGPGGPGDMGRRRRRRGGRDRRRPYDDYRPSRDSRDDRDGRDGRGGSRDRRGGDRGDRDRGDRNDGGRDGRDDRRDDRKDEPRDREPRDWREYRRARKERNGGERRDEREGRLGGYDNRW